MYKIISDSSCDMVEYTGIDFTSVPLSISTGEKTYIDDRAIDVHDMLDYLAEYKGRSYTACPSVNAWLSAFGDAEEIYVCTMTSGLSGTFNSASIAMGIYLEGHPDAKIHVFDSLSTGPELRLHIEKVIELKEQGKSFEEIVAYMPEYIKSTRLFFSFFSLHNFAQNGRVNKVLASAIGMLGISVLGTASEEGTVESIGKCRGDKKAVFGLLNEVVKCGCIGGKIRICHVENEKLAARLVKALTVTFPDADIKCYPAKGICSYYGERGGLIVGCETEGVS